MEVRFRRIDPTSVEACAAIAAYLAHLESVARSLGHRRLVLDTNGSLTEAITMYERAGDTVIERYNDNPYAHHRCAKAL